MQKTRYVILDALRGFAILGIILANFPEFSLWTFSDPATWTATDKVTRAVQTFLVDGKFYTLFSLLFGIGFSIQLAGADGQFTAVIPYGELSLKTRYFKDKVVERRQLSLKSR